MRKIFMLLFLLIIMGTKVKSYDLIDTFYYDTKVSDMYITKVKGDVKKNGAPFLLHKSNGDLVYCIEPFLYMAEDNYEGYIGYKDTFGLSEDVINKMNIIAYYGYGYPGHTDLKWYGLSQYLIWEALSLDDLYFTDSYNGNRIVAYEEELKEFRKLVEDYDIVPSFDDIYNVEEGNLVLEDKNNVLSNYDVITDFEIKVEGNKLIINNLKEGNYKIEFIKKDNSKDYVLYYSSKGQNLLLPGKINDVKKDVIINVKKGRLNISKYDKETISVRDNLTFKDTIYGIYDINDNLIKEVSLDEFGKASIDLKFGSYYIKEIKPPVGYLKDLEKHYFEINFDNSVVNLDVYDEIISKNIIIYKLYGNKKSAIYSYEQGASFEIYDSFNNLIGTYKTDERGVIQLKLPYGKYRLHQITSKEGYDKVEDYFLEVADTNDLEVKLYDYEKIIEVPDTYKDDIDYPFTIFIILLMLLFNIGIYAYRKFDFNS